MIDLLVSNYKYTMGGTEVIHVDEQEKIIAENESTQTDELNQKTANTILETMHQQPGEALQELLKSKKIWHSRPHIIFDLIEEWLYEQNEQALLHLEWTSKDLQRIHEHIHDIKAKFHEYYSEDDAARYMNRLITVLFPDAQNGALEESIKNIVTHKKK